MISYILCKKYSYKYLITVKTIVEIAIYDCWVERVNIMIFPENLQTSPFIVCLLMLHW